MRARRALVLPTLLLVLTACNSSGSGTTDEPSAPATEASEDVSATEAPSTETDTAALDRVVEAAEATAEEGTVAFEITIETENTQGEDGVQPLSAEGQEDFENQQREVTFEAPGGELRALIDDTDVYVEVPGTEDETWARVELESLVAGGTGFGGPGGLPFRSASDNLRVLESAVTSAAEGEEEDVRGETATRYDLTVDLEQAAEQAAESNETWEALAEQSGITELDMQVWVDDSDLIRRIAYSLDLSQAQVDAATEGADVEVQPAGVVTVAVDYFDYGPEVEIELPEEDQIVDVDEEQIRDSLTVPGS